jgi:hypothetical protein
MPPFVEMLAGRAAAYAWARPAKPTVAVRTVPAMTPTRARIGESMGVPSRSGPTTVAEPADITLRTS